MEDGRGKGGKEKKEDIQSVGWGKEKEREEKRETRREGGERDEKSRRYGPTETFSESFSLELRTYLYTA